MCVTLLNLNVSLHLTLFNPVPISNCISHAIRFTANTISKHWFSINVIILYILKNCKCSVSGLIYLESQIRPTIPDQGSRSRSSEFR